MNNSNNEWQAALHAAGAVIEEGTVLHFGDPQGETRAAANGDVVADLSHLALIRVHGADAESFLQGQLSNDTRLVTGTHSQLSAYCNPKGRMLAIFRVFKRDDSYFLQLPAALLESTLKRLSMFVLRAKVKLAADPGLVGIGISGPNAVVLVEKFCDAFSAEIDTSHTHADITAIRLPGSPPRLELIGPAAAMQPLWDHLKSTATPVGMHVWRWLDIQAGLPTVLPGTVEEFVPQMANLELVGGVSFKKGCYPGQEIVARMHYLGRLKQRMVRAHVQTDSQPAPGSPVYAPDFPGQSAGTVVDAQRAPTGGYDLLAVIQTSSIEKADIHLEQPGGPRLQLSDLPYPLPLSQSQP